MAVKFTNLGTTEVIGNEVKFSNYNYITSIPASYNSSLARLHRVYGLNIPSANKSDIVRTLKEAYSYISDPGHWVSGMTSNHGIDLDQADQFCAIGAVMRFSNMSQHWIDCKLWEEGCDQTPITYNEILFNSCSKVLNKNLKVFADIYPDTTSSIPSLNDGAGHGAIMALFEFTIAELEAELIGSSSKKDDRELVPA